MNKPTRQTLAWLGVVAVFFWTVKCRAQFFGEAKEESGILVIHADGSCACTNVYLQPRTELEQQMRQYERLETAGDAADDESTNAPETKETAPKAFKDDELIKKVESFGADNEWLSPEEKFSAVITNGMVRIQMSRSFASLEELLSDTSPFWRHGLAFQSQRFETDTNGQVRVTLTSQPRMQRYFKTMRAGLKLAGSKSEFQLVFPGKVLASSLPETQGNMTRFVLDGKNDESLDAAMKLYSAPVVITAEAGGLKIPAPLDSKNLRRTARRSKTSSELPVADAGPGFVAEAESITTTTLHVFPGGKDFFEDGVSGSMNGQPGTMITVKIFAPKGRTLQSISEVRMIKAVDDKGRNIAPAESEVESGETVFSGQPKSESASVQLGLQLPAPDAQAINEVDGEAIAVTAGAWKEMLLTNLQANATNEIDLAEVLPGAKLVITKTTTRQNETIIQANVKGPATIQSLDFKAKIPGIDQMNSSCSERHFATKDGVSTRSIYIQSYSFSDKEGTGPISLVVRHPEDLRRERVHYKLTGLDLF